MIDEPTRRLDEGALRALVPRVLAGLVRRGEDFDAAEDALQEAVLEALRVWPQHPPRDPRAWLATVATRRLVDARRSEAARHRREEATYAEPRPAATKQGDDTLFLPITEAASGSITMKTMPGVSPATRPHAVDLPAPAAPVSTMKGVFNTRHGQPQCWHLHPASATRRRSQNPPQCPHESDIDIRNITPLRWLGASSRTTDTDRHGRLLSRTRWGTRWPD